MMDNFNLAKNSNLFIISAPSGAGKTSLVRSICNRCDFLVPSISFTTRKKRESEVSNKDYYFITKEVFDKKVTDDEFLECQQVYGNYYGTGINETSNLLRDGKDVILEIDYKGMMSIKQIFPQAISIYIVPPSLGSLRQRLGERGQDTDEVINHRMKSSTHELVFSKFADYVIVNDNFTKALRELLNIIITHRINSIRLYKWLDQIVKIHD
tara:strand:+ start:1454 stop:2086 length:633 start_codon:yes stop_codon:yes gene_type:complete